MGKRNILSKCNLHCCLTFALMQLCLIVNAQISKSNLLNYPKRLYKVEGLRSPLIEEEKYYNFRIKKISPLREGYVIRAITHVDRKKVSVAIISPISDTFACLDCKYLKKGNRYPLALQRYFIAPAKHIGMECGSVEDVLLGNQIVNVNNSGFFYYLFTSKNLKGLQVFPKSYADSLIMLYCKDSLELQHAIKQFVAYFSFSTKCDDVLDTLKIKESILRYGGSWHRKFEDQWWPYGDRSWWLDSIPKRMDWSKETFANKPIDTTSFSQLFLKVCSYHKLPLPDSLCDREITNIAYKFLYYTHPGIFTVHVTWEIAGIDKIYATIVNVQKDIDGSRVTALNKPSCFYGQQFEDGNRHFFKDDGVIKMIFY